MGFEVVSIESSTNYRINVFEFIFVGYFFLRVDLVLPPEEIECLFQGVDSPCLKIRIVDLEAIIEIGLGVCKYFVLGFFLSVTELVLVEDGAGKFGKLDLQKCCWNKSISVV